MTRVLALVIEKLKYLLLYNIIHYTFSICSNLMAKFESTQRVRILPIEAQEDSESYFTEADESV